MLFIFSCWCVTNHTK